MASLECTLTCSVDVFCWWLDMIIAAAIITIIAITITIAIIIIIVFVIIVITLTTRTCQIALEPSCTPLAP